MHSFETICKGLTIASFAFALSYTSTAQAAITVSSNTCYNPPVPCESSDYSAEDWAAVGNACIKKSFGKSGNFIDPNAGIDSSSKLTTMEDAVEKPETGSYTVPSCSVVKLDSDTCALRCVLTRY